MGIEPEAGLDQVLGSFGLADSRITRLEATYGIVCECAKDGKSYIVKTYSGTANTEDELLGELDWIRYLDGNGVSVSSPVLSANGSYIEAFGTDGGKDFLICYGKAEGIPPRSAEAKGVNKTTEYIRNWGKLTGKMHSLAKGYMPTSGRYKRKSWKENIDFFSQGGCPASEGKVRSMFDREVERIEGFPTGTGNYGMIHNDMHEDNFTISGKRITLFDFDNCCYSWFANDIAIALFYRLFGFEGKAKAAAAHDFLGPFLEGYAEENAVDAEMLAEIPSFLKIRELDNYSMFFGDFTDGSAPDFVRSFMEGRKERIENGEPYVAYDFRKLCAE